jgi:uncharacterized protein (DUF1800 family)
MDNAVSQTVWKLLYGVTDAQMASPTWLAADDDGDGVSNGAEIAAGTNPFSAGSAIKINSITADATNVFISFPTMSGKQYVVQKTSTLSNSASWAALTPSVQVTGDGNVQTLTAPKGSGTAFFRVLVQDIDTDGDGVSDWAEKVTGFRSDLATTHAGANDYTSIVAALPNENKVSITTTKSTATQPPDALTAPSDQATVTVTRTGTLLFSSITVPLTKSGTASEGVDYDSLPASVTFPPKAASVSFTVNPKANTGRRNNATASFKTMAGGGYTLAGADTASVVIYPAAAASGTGLTAKYYVGAYGTSYSSLVNFGGGTVPYTYTKLTTTTGTATITLSSTTGFSTSTPLNRVNLQFSAGALVGGTYNKVYTITAVTSTTLTVAITGTAVPNSQTGSANCVFNPPVITRIDPMVDNYYYYGVPSSYTNGSPDNFSATWDTYLAPTTTGSYTFQLDADDKARVFLNSGSGDVQILENGWDTTATGTFKQSAAFTLTTGTRYHLHVDFAETTGYAKCKLQWKLGTGNFGNISSANAFTTLAGTTVGWTANYYANATFTAPIAQTVVESTGPVAYNNGDWGVGSPDTTLIYPDYFCARWTGQVLPQYSERYYFVGRADDGVKIWVNNQLIVDRWPGGGATDITGGIDLQAGVLYDIKVEYYEATGSAEAHLSWYSDSQPKQIIPTNRLFPDSTQTAPLVAAPTAVTSSLTATAVAGNTTPFTYTITASNGPTSSFSATGLPSWLTLNSTTGVLTGSPTAVQAGHYQIVVSATNPSGTGSSVVDIEVINTGSQVTRELWTTGVTGSGISDIPVNAAPSSKDTALASLEDSASYADNTGERLRGYFVPAVTGNYYFWLAANNVAELWISNDAEPINKIRRAYVTSPGTTAKAWSTAGQTNQKSPWLALTAGKKYYYEVLHNTGSGTTDHVSVGWLLDATGTSAAIVDGTSVVPGYPLMPYDYPATVVATGSLYATNMSPQGVASSKGTGSANMRLSADGTQAILHFTYGGLGSPKTAYHVHCDPFGANPSQIIYDIDDIDSFHPELRTSDGGYIWNITAVGTLSAADVLSAITTGKTYINVHSVNYPNGEIRGNFTLVTGSQSAPAFVADPGYADDHTTDAGAARFLMQATYGVDPTDLANVKSMGYSAWIDSQFSQPASRLVPDVLANVTADINNLYADYLMWNAWWKKSITGPDQLRQRMAFALSEILVVSDVGPLNNNGRILADHYDTLLDYSFANFRDILKQVTLTPAMGIYLDMRGNPKGSLITGLHPNENYAREIMQLFSIGLNRMWPNGTLMLDSQGNLIPTYTQTEILGMARVFTGWNYGQNLQGNGRLPTSFSPSANYLDPMVLVPSQHELGSKRVLDNVVLPAAKGFDPIGTFVAGTESDPAQTSYDTYCLNDLEKAIDSIMSNTNVGPYICRQLIQRLVTSQPSGAYLQRVVAKFNDDGTASHVRGNMQAVIKAILLDGEARNSATARSSTVFGKQREPLVRLAGLARTFPASGTTGTYAQSTGTSSNRIDITTSSLHNLSGSSTVFLDFSGNLTQASPPLPASNPTSTNYTVLTSPAPTATTFSVNATGMTNTTYSQTAGSNILTVNTGGPTATTGSQVWLQFLSGTGTSGKFTVTSNPTSSSFTVTAGDTTARSGSVLVPKIGSSYSVATATTANGGATTITVNSIGNHNLNVGDHIWFDANSAVVNGVVDGDYAVTAISDEDHFTLNLGVLATPPTNQSQNSNTYYPLVAPPLGRSGSMRFDASTFAVGRTDAQSPTAWTDLNQTPLNSPTVFNFFYPDYKYPGTLGNANITTPEFQLTTDTSVVNMTNSFTYMLLGTGGGNGNTSGLASYPNGGGRITINLSTYQTPAYTSNAGVSSLVDKMSDLLVGGPLNANTKSTIVNFVTYQKPITALTNTNPCTVTVTGHGLSTGDSVTISGVTGTTFSSGINATLTATVTGANTFTVPVSFTSTGLDLTNATISLLPYTTASPTATQMRDRVRAVVHLIVTSPEYVIQK